VANLSTFVKKKDEKINFLTDFGKNYQ